MVVGVVIALFQALTQVQEITLTFIPKIIVILLVTALTGPFIGGADLRFRQRDLRPHRNRLLSRRRARPPIHLRASPG